MAATAQYLADSLLAWLKHTAMPSTITTGYIGLFTTLSTLATQGTEVSGGSYARKSITMATAWSAVATDADGSRYITNAADLVFATPTADWGDVVGWELIDASSAGNRYAYGELNPHQFIASGSVYTVPASSLKIKVA